MEEQSGEGLAFLEEQTLFANIVNIAAEAIMTIDQAHQVVLFNQGAENIFGYSASEIIAQPIDILIPARFIEQYRLRMTQFVGSDAVTPLRRDRQEIVGLRKSGQEFPAEASMAKFELNGKQYLTIILRDITTRKLVEKEREELINGLKILDESTQAITSELSIDQVLQKIVQAAKNLIQVKFAALGVHDGGGKLSRFITAGVSQESHAEIGALPVGKGLLGLILHQGKSIIVNEMMHHPSAVGFPEHHPEIRQLLGVPIYSREKLIGAFYLADKEGGAEFTRIDQELIEMLARHATIAIENARLYEKMQRLAVLEERERFARDLHDGIIQSIYGVGLSLDNAKVLLTSNDKELIKILDTTLKNLGQVNDILDMSMKNLAQVITDVRNYIFDLRPQALKGKDLETRLYGLIKEMQVNTLLIIDSDIDSQASEQLDSTQASHVFHIVHEALANIVRHAKAHKVSLSLGQNETGIHLRIEDDGIGFDLPTEVEPGHHGLANMYARAALIDAELEIDSAYKKGTRLSLDFDPNTPTKGSIDEQSAL